jgi:hypothetical protein
MREINECARKTSVDWEASMFRVCCNAMAALAVVGSLSCFAASKATAGQYLRVSTPHAETFTIKRHMSFWSEPESYNTRLDAFLAKVK